MKRRISCLIILAMAFVFLMPFLQAVPQDIRSELLETINLQKAAWNNNDLQGYMAMYWKSPELTYHSGSIKVRGWDAIFELYNKKYPRDERGVLDFSDLEVNVLCSNTAYVLGRWKVTTSEKVREGVFTLIFKRRPEGWRIIHDHAS